MKLIRCSSCRYSFERADDDTRRDCPQCGAILQAKAEVPPEVEEPTTPPDEAIEDRKTRKIHIIPMAPELPKKDE